MVTFIVLDGNTFGYTDRDTSAPFVSMTVLAVDALLGGDPGIIDNTVLAFRQRFRLATDDDFDAFRVSRQGYEQRPDEYRWDRNKR